MFKINNIHISDDIHDILLNYDGTIFLDSSFTNHNDSRYSLYAIDPIIQLKGSLDKCECKYENDKVEILNFDPFSVVDKLVKNTSEKPFEWCEFNAGFVGMFSYEAAKVFSDFSHCIHESKYPLMLGGIYDRFIIIDHKSSKSYFITTNLYGRNHIQFEQLRNKVLEKKYTQGFSKKENQEIKSITYKEYKNNFNKAKHYIKNGDIYQINYSMKYTAKKIRDSVELYNDISSKSPSPYGAYLNCFNYQIISNSPELFFKKENLNIQTKPIKGTIKRGENIKEDLKQKSKLLKSKKDTAELIMITDLERNDLNKICKTNTVKVESLRDIQEFKYLFHTFSTIKGELKNEYCLYDIMKCLFPGGSITGAPKLRSMEIIHELEPNPRGPYTGSIGFVSSSNDMTFNIAIRTMYTLNDNFVFHSGGALVSDSKPEKEYNECLLKSKAFINTLNIS